MDGLAGLNIVISGRRREAIGARTKQTFAVGTIDVDGLVQRLDSMPHTNRSVWTIWSQPEPGFPNGHGLALAQRADDAARKILDEAIVKTNEFSVHDAVIAFTKRGMDLGDKVIKQPLDDNPSSIWDEVRDYFVDGSNLVNQVESIADKSVKWSDVKDVVKKTAEGTQETVKYTYWITVGAAVLVLGIVAAGVSYGVRHKIAGR